MASREVIAGPVLLEEVSKGKGGGGEGHIILGLTLTLTLTLTLIGGEGHIILGLDPRIVKQFKADLDPSWSPLD